MIKDDPAYRLGKGLKKRKWTISVAESCTGGGLASRITDIPGSSSYFLGGIIAYHNRIKEELLAVPASVIAQFGAVSEQAAKAMAAGCKKALGSNVSVGITGIAGPGGGTPDKPVGLVYIALAGPSGIACKRFHFPGDRKAVRRSAVDAALEMVNSLLDRIDP